jgi:hypothetical protein
MDRRRRRWREDDEALRREFEDYLASGRQDAAPGESPGA